MVGPLTYTIPASSSSMARYASRGFNEKSFIVRTFSELYPSGDQIDAFPFTAIDVFADFFLLIRVQPV